MPGKSKRESKRELKPKLRFRGFRDAPSWAKPTGDELFDQISNKNAESGLPVLAITQEHGAVPRDEIDYHVSVTDKSVESYKEVCSGDFIISLRSFQGGIEFSDYHGLCSPAYVILRRKTDAESEYFKHLFKSHRFIQHMTRNLEGLRDGKMISYKQFSEVTISLPADLAEQTKIAGCLSSLDELIGAESRKLEALQAHKKGLMQQLFPREGETLPRLRFPKFKNAPEWKEKKLGDIANISSGSTPLRSNNEFFDGGTIPWVKTTDLNNSFITTTEESITPKAKARINPVGSVLVAMYGGFKQIGRTGYLKIPAATNQALSVLRVDENEVMPIYLLVWLNAKIEDWKRIASSSRKDPNITGSDVGSFRIRFPSTQEQQKIADCLATFDELVESQNRKIDVLKTHKKGLMQQLFPSMEDAHA